MTDFLNIPEKQNHPIAEQAKQQYGSEYFLAADEVNQMVDRVNELKDITDETNQMVLAIADGTGGKAYPDLTAAMAVVPLPEDGTIFTIDDSNEEERGIYAYDSTESEGYRFVREIQRIDSVFTHKSPNPVEARAISDYLFDEEIVEEEFPTIVLAGTTSYSQNNTRAFGFPIGAITNLKSITFRVGSLNTITSFRIRIKRVDYSGEVVLDEIVSVSITGTGVEYEYELPEVYANDAEENLWVEIFGDVTFAIYKRDPGTVFTYPEFPKNRHTTQESAFASGLIGTEVTPPYDVYVKVKREDRFYKIKEDLIEPPEPEPFSTEFNPENDTDRIPAKAVADYLFDKNEYEEEIELVSATNSVYGTGIHGWGFPIGNPKNLKTVILKYAVNVADITQMRIRLRKNDENGEVLSDETLSVNLTNGTTAAEYIYDLPEVVANEDGDLVWLEIYTNQPIRMYIVNPGVVFTEALGYPMARWLSSMTMGEGSFTSTGDYRDFYVRYVCEVTDYYIKNKFLTGTQETAAVDILPNENLRYSFVGSSVTWEDGYLQSGFVKNIIEKLQERAEVHPSSAFVGPKLNNVKYYRGQVLELGEGAEIEFKLTGNEVSIVQSMDRINDNASEIEIYIDGELYDTFNNFTPTEIGSDTKEFTGNGTDVMFDLGRAFTYNHVVTVGGSAQVVTHNTNQGVGFSIPGGADCAIIRKLGIREDGSVDVNHWLWFKTAPANLAEIEISFDYGEEINYEKSTIGKNTAGANECPYGDGDVSFDPLEPSSIGAGLDFRETDSRAIVTYRFEEEKERTVKLKVKGLYGEASGTPYFRFNFATNRIFYFQNAGIGGWGLSRLLQPTSTEPTRNWQNVLKFNPDKIVLETTPNDDWAVFGHKIYKIDTANLATLRKIKTFPLRHITYNAGTDDYEFSKWRGVITAITRSSVTFDGSVEGAIAKGDVLLIGQYWSNNRDYIERIVESYDAGTKTIYFDKLINDEEIIYGSLSGFIGKEISVRDLSVFTDDLNGVATKFAENSSAEIYVLENPMPNVLARELWGYPDAIKIEANQHKNLNTIKYESLRKWQETQETTSVIVDVGDAVHDNYLDLDYIEFGTVGQNLVYTDIFQDGVSIYGTKAVVENAWAWVPDPSLSGSGLNKTPSFKTNYKQIYNGVKPRVILLDETLTGEIEVRITTSKWSADSCHMSGQFGEELYAQFLKEVLQ